MSISRPNSKLIGLVHEGETVREIYPGNGTEEWAADVLDLEDGALIMSDLDSLTSAHVTDPLGTEVLSEADLRERLGVEDVEVIA